MDGDEVEVAEEPGGNGVAYPTGRAHSLHELDACPPEAAYLRLSCHTCGGEGVKEVRVVG